MKMKNLTRAVVLVLLMSVLLALACGCVQRVGNEDADNTEATSVDLSDTTVIENIELNIAGVRFHRFYKVPDAINAHHLIATEEAAIAELLNILPNVFDYSAESKIKCSDIEARWFWLEFVDIDDNEVISLVVTESGVCYLCDETRDNAYLLNGDNAYLLNGNVDCDALIDIYKHNTKVVYGSY